MRTIAFAFVLCTFVDAGFTQDGPDHQLYQQQYGASNKHPMPARSFYQSRSEWQHIIDSTWGPGAPLATKLTIFDAYAGAVTNKFDGFLSLGLDWTRWDSLKTAFRSRIDSTTSRGTFTSIMGQFAMHLRDAHTWAWDTAVINTPPVPGVPILILSPFAQADHFGAVLTALPDSTALVLRTVPNHPLGLQPGDIILGYERVPWKNLVKELLDAQLPVYSAGVGTNSAAIHAIIRNVGNNWHLFSTIDIVKHASVDTLHLSVTPLLNLPTNPMMGNEQLEIPGIPFSFYHGWPWTPTGQLLAFGKLPSANVGYIRLQGEYPSNAADPLFAKAVDSLRKAEGLIIDLRWNSGGWSTFSAAFAKMYSQSIYTMNDAYRVSSGTLALTPAAHSSWFAISGAPGSIYDRPIAVLIGPTCQSLGEITAYWFRYHPMARVFGKSSIGSQGDNEDLAGYQGWWLHYSICDMYHLSQPGQYINRQEFPIDESIWFDPDNVAQGIDPVLEHAIQWISMLSYAHDCVLNRDTVKNATDSVRITASVKNPLEHILAISAFIINSQGATVDSVSLHRASVDTLWSAMFRTPRASGRYYVSVRTYDSTSASYSSLPNVASFLGVYTDVEEAISALPARFALHQNYPNPFNPSTTIRYQLPLTTHVLLKVHNLLGQEVATLVNEMKYAGFYTANWDASRLASGVYFYTLSTGKFRETKRMILMK